MKILKYLSALFLILLFMTYCREPKELEFREFNNMALDNLGFSASVLKVNLVYFNPNNFGMELKRTELDIYVDSNFLGHSSQELQVTIPRKDVFTIPLRIDLDMKNLFKNGFMTLMNKEVNVRALGNVKVGKAGVYKNFKVDYTTKQKFSMF